jgi:carbon monoxide dehydrogenase subunit G
MVRFDFAVEIDRAASEVWDWLTDPSRVPEWQSSLVSAEQVGGEPMGVGTRIHDARRFGGRTIDSVVEVTEYEPQRLFTLHGISGPVRFDIRQRLEPLGEDRTRVAVEARADPGGLSRFTAPLISHRAEREMRCDFERLKQLLERAP